MKMILDALTSETAGFLLKLFSGIAAAAFGMLGIGTKTREDNGAFTPNGRIALIGIVIAGLFAIGTSVYDFANGQQKARDDRLKNQRLMVSIQRGLYPLKDITADLTIDVAGTFAGYDDYKSELLQALPHYDQCVDDNANKSFRCTGLRDSGGYIYEIPQESPLFPKQSSPTAIALDSFYLVLGILPLGVEPTKTNVLETPWIPLRDIALRLRYLTLLHVAAN